MRSSALRRGGSLACLYHRLYNACFFLRMDTQKELKIVISGCPHLSIGQESMDLDLKKFTPMALLALQIGALSSRSLAVYHPLSSEAQRKMVRRSETGPISLAVRALLTLPDVLIEQIVLLLDNKRLMHNSRLQREHYYADWSGTQRMVNSRSLIRRFWRPTHWKLREPRDHFTPEYRMIKYTLPPGY